MPQRWSIIAAACAAWTATGVSQGADVRFGISPRETYVGAPIQVQITIDDAEAYDPPEFPEILNAEVRSAGTSRNVRQVGRRVSTSVTYTYHVIPRRAGVLTIPPISVGADGETFTTVATKIRVLKSDKGDLLYVQLLGDDAAYVGEPVDVTLELWLKPFEQNGVRLDERDMWQTIDQKNSAWGPFIANLQGRSPDVSYRTEHRPDATGRSAKYFVYTLNRTVWPERPGEFDGGGVTIVVNYPLSARRSRFMLLGRHEITNARVISAAIEDSALTVKPLPMDDRPDGFRGAVGRYAFAVTAAPAEMSVGDPITLRLAIRGTGRLEPLQAPLLARQESLTEHFRVPDEELAGIVERGTKVFTQSIRAKHDSVTEIPPIEFSYFDPDSERYVTVQSDPIPITVKESTRLSVSRVVEGAAGPAAGTRLALADTGLLANYDDIDQLLSQQTLSIGWGSCGVVAGGPLLCAATFLVRRRRERVAGDTGFVRRRSAHRTAVGHIRRAGADGGGPVTADIATAVTGYVADRCNLPPAGLTRADAVKELLALNVPKELVGRVDELLTECESAQYGAAAQTGANDLVKRAHECVNELERRKFRH